MQVVVDLNLILNILVILFIGLVGVIYKRDIKDIRNNGDRVDNLQKDINKVKLDAQKGIDDLKLQLSNSRTEIIESVSKVGADIKQYVTEKFVSKDFCNYIQQEKKT